MFTAPVHNFIASVPQLLETTTVENGLRTTVMQALRSCCGTFHLGKNAFLGVLTNPAEQTHPLYPEEEQVLSPNACAKKRIEFALGRAAARHALRELGQSSFPILRGAQGEPLWPDGITGSITHCSPWAVALVVRSEKRLAIGIDLENLEKAGTIDISGLICTDSELEWIHAVPYFRERLAMIFSAKEAAYKGFYRFFRRYLDFKDAELSWLPARQSFKVAFVGDAGSELPSFRGCEVHCRRFNGLVFSCLVYGPANEAAWPGFCTSSR